MQAQAQLQPAVSQRGGLRSGGGGTQTLASPPSLRLRLLRPAALQLLRLALLVDLPLQRGARLLRLVCGGGARALLRDGSGHASTLLRHRRLPRCALALRVQKRLARGGARSLLLPLQRLHGRQPRRHVGRMRPVRLTP